MRGHIVRGCIAKKICDNIAIQNAIKKQKKVFFVMSPYFSLSLQKYKHFSNWQNLFLRNETKKRLKINVRIYYSVC